MSFLNAGRSEHGKTGLAAGHDVGVIAKNREAVRSQRAGGNMEDTREQFSRDLVHIRNHEQETLRSGKGCGQGAGSQRTMDDTGSAALRLHFHHMDRLAENIFAALLRPFVNVVSHR